MFAFIGRVIKAAVKTVKDFIVDLFHNAEATIVLVCASIGLTAVLSHLPFVIPLPLWVEGTMFFPLISVLIIWSLMQLASWRTGGLKA